MAVVFEDLSDILEQAGFDVAEDQDSPALTFAEIMNLYPSIAIAGGPRTGKTTMTTGIDRTVIRTDNFMELAWTDVPFAVIEAFRPGSVVEGVQVPRSLRKGLQVDAIVWTGAFSTSQNTKQASMGQGVLTVFRDWVSGSIVLPPVFSEVTPGVFSEVDPRLI